MNKKLMFPLHLAFPLCLAAILFNLNIPAIVHLGLVQANTTEPQPIACPIACVIESAARPVDLLPATDDDRPKTAAWVRRLIFGGLSLIIIGVAWGFIIRPIFRPQPPPYDTRE